MISTTGIYEIRNLVNGKRYVGSAVNFGNRWRVHAQSLARGDHHSAPLQRAWRRYGPNAFQFNKILACSKEHLLMYEQICMDALAPEYNVAPRAGSQLGFKHSDESREKMRDSRLAYDFKPWLGKTRSQETKDKISASRKGKGGGPMSAERRAKIGAAHIGRVITAEHRAKIAATLSGHVQTQEQIAKRMANMPVGHYERFALSKRSLSDDQIREIRASHETQAALALRFGIGASCISRIKARITYASVI